MSVFHTNSRQRGKEKEIPYGKMIYDSFEGSMFKKFGGPNDLTRLEGTRRKTKLSLMDDDDGVRAKVGWRKPILLDKFVAFSLKKD